MLKSLKIYNLEFISMLLGVFTIFFCSTVFAKNQYSIEPSELIAQPFFEQISAESPVIQGSNYSSIEDSNGFIWFGGTAGLARYDGYEFVNFLPDANNPEAIKGLHVNTMAADKNGGLWLGIYKVGLAYYSAKSQQFTYFPHDPSNNNSPASNLIKKIIVLKNGDLWIGTANGVNYFDTTNHEFTHYVNTSNKPKADFIISMATDQQERLWVSTATGICLVDKSNQTFSTVLLNNENAIPFSEAELDKMFRKLVTLDDGRLLLGGFFESIFELNPKLLQSRDIQPTVSSNKLIHGSIEQVNPSEVWVKTLDRDVNKQTINILDSQSLSNKYSLVDNQLLKGGVNTSKVVSFNTDTNQNTWMTTVDMNPKFTNQALKAFRYYRPNDGSIYSKKNYVAKHKHSDSKTFLLSRDSLDMIDRKAQLVTTYQFQLNEIELSPFRRMLITDSSTFIWIASKEELIELNLDTGSYHSYSIKGHLASGSLIKEIDNSAKNQLLISTSGGPLLFDLKDRKFSTMVDQHGKLIVSNSWSATRSEQGLTFVSTIDGLYYSNKKTREFRLISNNSEAFNGAAIYVYNDNNNKTWLFTDKETYQVNVFNSKPTFNKIVSYDGNTPINRNLIAFDQDNDIWFGPYVYFDTKINKYIELGHYKKSHNINRLIGNQKFGYPIFWSNDSTLMVDKSNLKPLKTDKKIKLISMQSGPFSLPINSSEEPIQIDSSTQEFTAKYVVIDPLFSREIEYQYKLIGYDKYWRTGGFQDRRASYNNVPPGVYTLSITAKNILSGQSYMPLEFKIQVAPKYFQTIWFKLITALIFLLLVYYFIQWRVKVVQRKERERFERREAEQRAEMLNELMIKKNQLLSDVSHELGTPLTVLKLQVQALKDDIEDDVQATYDGLDRKISDISLLISDLHQLAQADSSTLQLQKANIILSEKIQGWEEDFKEIFISKDLSLSMEYLLTSELSVYCDQDKIKQIVTNLLANSSKYTEEPGNILLKVSNNRNHLIITIEDSYPGVNSKHLDKIFDRLYRCEHSRNRESGGSGLGLAICKSLVAAHDGKIYAEESILGGLKVTVELPFNQLT